MANEVLYGFAQLKDQFGERALTVGEEHVSRAIGLTLEEHNRRINEMVGVFCDQTTQYQVNFRSLSAGRLQPMDQFGRPRPILTSKYTVAYPMRMGAAGTGENFVTAAKLTVKDVNDRVAQVLLQDIRWIRDQILAAIFASSSYTYADEEYGDLTVQGLANSDTVQYAKDGGISLATDTHYLGQAAAIADATNPFDDIYDELMEHPENDGEVIVFVPTANKATTMALTNFIDAIDPNVVLGTGNNRLATGGPGVPYPGDLIGYTDKCWVVEWKSLPSNYLIGVTTQGDRPLRMRQEPEPELQGLILRGREDSPFSERHWYRRAGFGAHNRVGAVVHEISDSSYDVPVGYEQPFA